MLYIDFLKTRTACPFCEPVAGRAFAKNELAFLTYALAPYHQHHLLVVPQRHIESFHDLTPDESAAIDALVRQGVHMLESIGYEDYTVLVRSGMKSGKSVSHLHYHIIPSVVVGDLDHKGDERKVMTDEEIERIFSDFGGALKNI